MKNEIQDKEEMTRQSKGKFWRNIWLGSTLVFIATLILFLLRIGVGSEVTPAWISIPMLLSMPVGILAFIIWFVSSENKIARFITKLTLKVVIGGVALILLLSLIYAFVFYPSKIYGTSMEPSFKNGEYVLINRIGAPKRGEVIDYTKDGGEYVGRVLGLPGEIIHIKPGEVSVNGKAIDEPYADWSKWAENREMDITLKDNEYLVLLDKRSGNNQIVKKESIIGKFFYRYWPPSASGFIKY